MNRNFKWRMRWMGHVACAGKNSPCNIPWRPRRGVEVQLYTFFNLGTRWWWVVNATPRPLYPRERDAMPIVQETGWAPGQVWTCAENLALTGIQSPARAVRSESLYRLSYRGLRSMHRSDDFHIGLYVTWKLLNTDTRTQATIISYYQLVHKNSTE